VRDFMPVVHLGNAPSIMLVPNSSPAKTVKEWIDYAKKNPGRLNYASSGNGTIVQLSAELFKAQADVFVVHIPYKGTALAIPDLVSGKVDAAALDITVWKKFVTENKVDTKDVNVFFTTPTYFNYNWSVHADMPAALQEKIKAALLALNPANPEHAEILRLNRATRYIETKPENYKELEAAARNLGLL
jgi:ABC-type phosphate/phosphonate transport system substrate-binding protein